MHRLPTRLGMVRNYSYFKILLVRSKIYPNIVSYFAGSVRFPSFVINVSSFSQGLFAVEMHFPRQASQAHSSVSPSLILHDPSPQPGAEHRFSVHMSSRVTQTLIRHWDRNLHLLQPMIVLYSKEHFSRFGKTGIQVYCEYQGDPDADLWPHPGEHIQINTYIPGQPLHTCLDCLLRTRMSSSNWIICEFSQWRHVDDEEKMGMLGAPQEVKNWFYSRKFRVRVGSR